MLTDDLDQPFRTPRSREERSTATRELFELTRTATTEAERERIHRHLVVINMEVARALAARHRSKGIPQEDLEQVAYLALVRAVTNFDLGRDHDFLTYAVPCIRGELRKHFRDHGWMVRPPRPVQEVQARVVEARDRLAGAHGDNVPLAAIAADLDIEVTLVEQALAAEGCFRPSSLDAPSNADDMGAVRAPAPLISDQSADRDRADVRTMLRPVMRHLAERDRRVLSMRFLSDCTQQEIADELGITQTQVSRLIARILGDLRELVGSVDAP
ncbi:sigma-70 family RNA polymerase sigma factor [Nocardioides alkalitolerans]|uniref:sigma-70 family RNA polymerase sigma factor n=1 Tax=Nocardioides alkalitolerans TaxID=281714 RepID=UPI0003FCE075|nr:sigma-70 family RNA polymerase sigma factor [Nocardioides alkalitolerans]